MREGEKNNQKITQMKERNGNEQYQTSIKKPGKDFSFPKTEREEKRVSRLKTKTLKAKEEERV